MKLACIVNPASGGKKGALLLARLRALAGNDRCAVDVYDLSSTGVKDRLPEAFAHERVLIAGGDGTVSSLLPLALKSQAILGLLPLGTGNDLAKELGLFRGAGRRSLPEQLEYYAGAPARRLAVWRLAMGPELRSTSERATLFCNYVSLGFDAQVVADYVRWRERLPQLTAFGVLGNRLQYACGAAANLHSGAVRCGRLLRGKELVYAVTGAAVRSVIFANIRSYAGLGISNPAGSPFDDLLEGVVVRTLGEYAAMAACYHWTGPKPLLAGAAASWVLKDIPVGTPVQVDGEARGDLSVREAGWEYRIEPAGFANVAGDSA